MSSPWTLDVNQPGRELPGHQHPEYDSLNVKNELHQARPQYSIEVAVGEPHTSTDHERMVVRTRRVFAHIRIFVLGVSVPDTMRVRKYESSHSEKVPSYEDTSRHWIGFDQG